MAKRGQSKPRPSDGMAAPRELTDDQKQALWFQSKGKIIALRNKMATVTADLRNEYKVLKAEIGITKADADFAIALDSDEDDKMLEAERRRRMLARWEGHPIGAQADMFEGADRTPSVDKAYDAGKRAGMKGEPAKSPFDPSTEQHGKWMEGHHDGNQALARDGFKKLEEGAPESGERVSRSEFKDRLKTMTGDGTPKLGDQEPTTRIVN